MYLTVNVTDVNVSYQKGGAIYVIMPDWNIYEKVVVIGKTKTVVYHTDEEYSMQNEFWDGEFKGLLPSDPTAPKLFIGDWH